LRQSGDFGADWTARDRATWWVLIAWLLLRVVYLVNGLVLLATGWSVFAHRWMQLGLMIAIAAETAVLVPVTLRRRSYSSAAVIWADVTVVCVGLVLNGHALGPGVVDSGLNWFFAVSLGSAVGAAVGLPPLQAVVAVPAIGLAHCLPVARSWTGSGAAGGVQALAYALIGGCSSGNCSASPRRPMWRARTPYGWPPSWSGSGPGTWCTTRPRSFPCSPAMT